MAPVDRAAALFGGLVLAAVGGLLVDIPALRARGEASRCLAHPAGGIEIADTVVQDVAFVLAAVFFAQLGGRAVQRVAVRSAPHPACWRARCG